VAYQAMKNKLRGVNYISSSSSWLFGSRCCETLLLPLSILSAEFFMAGTETLSDDWTVSTHTHPFNGHFSVTTRVGQYQKGNTSLDYTEARDSEWQWHQLGHMQVCISLQTDNHASTSPLSF